MRVGATNFLIVSLVAGVVLPAISSSALALDDPFWKKLKNTGSRMEVFGDYSGAEASYRQAIESARKVSADRLVIAELNARLATALVTQGKLEAAEPYFQTVLADVPRFAQSGTRQEDLLACVDALGESYSEKANGSRALICFAHQKELLETAFPNGHPRLAHCLITMAGVNAHLQRYEEAKSLLRQALKVTRQEIPKKAQYQIQAELAMALVLENMGEHAGAASLIEHALGFAEKNQLLFVCDVPTAHSLLAVCYQNAGRKSEAQKLFGLTEAELKSSLAALEKKRKQRYLVNKTVETCFLGAMYYSFKRTDLAIKTSKTAIELIEKNFGPGNSALIGPLQILADIENQRHNPSAALKYEHRISAIKKSYATKL